MSDWIKKAKGNAKIYTHPLLNNAIVVNHFGIHYNGVRYASVDTAMKEALK